MVNNETMASDFLAEARSCAEDENEVNKKMKFRKNLSVFIAKHGMNYSAFAADRGISLSQLSQILHGTYMGTFQFWAGIAVDYNLTVSQMVDLYQTRDENRYHGGYTHTSNLDKQDEEEVAAWLKD